jgi:hypothetical protein
VRDLVLRGKGPLQTHFFKRLKSVFLTNDMRAAQPQKKMALNLFLALNVLLLVISANSYEPVTCGRYLPSN